MYPIYATILFCVLTNTHMASYNKLLICKNEHYQKILINFFHCIHFLSKKCTIYLKYYVTNVILCKKHVMMKQEEKLNCLQVCRNTPIL